MRVMDRLGRQLSRRENRCKKIAQKEDKKLKLQTDSGGNRFGKL